MGTLIMNRNTKYEQWYKCCNTKSQLQYYLSIVVNYETLKYELVGVQCGVCPLQQKYSISSIAQNPNSATTIRLIRSSTWISFFADELEKHLASCRVVTRPLLPDYHDHHSHRRNSLATESLWDLRAVTWQNPPQAHTHRLYLTGANLTGLSHECTLAAGNYAGGGPASSGILKREGPSSSSSG